jgi:hypothetical protein
MQINASFPQFLPYLTTFASNFYPFLTPISKTNPPISKGIPYEKSPPQHPQKPDSKGF